jgi:DNA-binding response OmpR family regulator
MKILIADDDPIYRRFLESTLRKWGCDVVVAIDGNQAWDLLRQQDSPKMAVLDWMMPGMDGIEICKMVRENDEIKDMYIILATGKGYKDDITTGISAGADDYITKPFEREELFTSIETGINSIELQSLHRKHQRLELSDAHSIAEEFEEQSPSQLNKNKTEA